MPSFKKISAYIEPMLAKETAEAFDDKGWLFEIKWDGYRAIAEKKKSKILLYSRNGLDFTETYPVVVDQLKKVKTDAVLDGEIVVLNDEGKPDFQFLQHYSENQNRPIQYYVFDLLELNGKDTTSLPLIDRKELLKKIIPEDNAVIKYSDHILEKGKSFFQVSKEKKLEGIMAKKADSKYYRGKRTTDWLKIKNHKTAEAIIAGYTEPAGSRKYFGSLILAAKEGKKLIYMGNAGTGFNAGSLKELYDLFRPLVQKKSPFEEKIKNNAKITWLKPAVICEVKFSEVTADGKLRHPVFLRLRDDKTINEINMDNIKDNRKSTLVKIKEKSKKQSLNASPSESKSVSSSNKSDKEETDKVYSFGKNQVTVTHFNKVYFPGEKITKGEVADYYISMADYILPYLKGRPESLLRNPNGIKAKGFFQKDAADDTPSYVHRKQIHSDSTKKEINYIVCDNIETLVYLNNLGCIEINPWYSTVDELDKPDYLMIDIDPSDKNTFEQVIQVALTTKKILDNAGAECFCKTSGATGMHIYVPTGKKYTFDQVKDFAYLVCMMVNDELKSFTTLERNLQKRGKKHIYMDYLQNRRGQTISSVYSLRPKPGATVSTPLLWEEVKPGLSPKQFTIYNTLERVEKLGDLFKGVLGKGIDLGKCLKNLQSVSGKVAAK
jgi:bifunctional non-homologous end joining protein LigD